MERTDQRLTEAGALGWEGRLGQVQDLGGQEWTLSLMEKDHMRMTILYITLAMLLLSSCSGFRATPQQVDATPVRVDPTPRQVTPTPETSYVEELEQAKQEIYRIVALPTCGSGVVHIYPEKVRYPLYEDQREHVPPQLPQASAETWESYHLVNDPNQPVATFTDFPIDCPYEFVTPSHVVCYDGETNCIVPHGFSEVAFNKAGTQALVYMYSDCSECGGGGSVYLLEKREGSWVLINELFLWVS